MTIPKNLRTGSAAWNRALEREQERGRLEELEWDKIPPLLPEPLADLPDELHERDGHTHEVGRLVEEAVRRRWDEAWDRWFLKGAARALPFFPPHDVDLRTLDCICPCTCSGR